MAQQHQQQPYPPNGGRGRGGGGRGNNGGYNTTGNPNIPSMNYAGRGGIPQQVGAWQPTPSAMFAQQQQLQSHINVQPVASTQQQLQGVPPSYAGGTMQGTPSSLQQARTPNLQPAPPHSYGAVTPQGTATNVHSQQQRQTNLQTPPPPYNTYNPYSTPSQYAYQQRQQQQWQQAPPPQYSTPNQQYRTPGGGGGTMYYPMMQQPMGMPNTGSGVGMQQYPMNPVLPPPREKKIATITDKNGNVIDLTSIRSSKKPTTTKTESVSTDENAVTTAAATPPVQKTSSSDAGAKLLQAALARIEGKDVTNQINKDETSGKSEAFNDKKTNAIEAVTSEKSSAANVDVLNVGEGNPSILQIDDKKSETMSSLQDLSINEKLDASATDDNNVETPTAPKSSLQALLTKPAIETPTAKLSNSKIAHVYPKDILLRLKNLPECLERPMDLPEMIISRTESRSGGDKGRPGPGGGGNSGRRNSSQRNMDNASGVNSGGDQWARGSTAPPRRQSSQTDRPAAASPADQWSRGQAPPKQQAPPPSSNTKAGGRGGRGSYTNNQYFEGPIEPLVKSENHWRPQKNTSAFVVAEKKVKAILNKMTKEKFDRLSEQMLEIPLLSYETLTMMINHVYEKAIDEPAFGDMYANLCVRLSQIASDNKFVHIIESDEEPPTDDGQVTSNDDGRTSHNKVYRWSHDVSTSDAEIVGPFSSIDECFDAAFDEDERTPTPRGELELELVSVTIRRSIFIKIMKKKSAEEGEEDVYYTVYFPINEASDCGQQISEIFLSEVECRSDASKKNSFKRSLLNKCEEEFTKKDIYDNWQKEKQLYEEKKKSLTEQERAEEEAELNFRRIKIKKQMLGNVKFIGQLYKVNLLREKVMRFCIGSLLKLEEKTIDPKAKNPEYEDNGNTDIDEEDHEAICNMFATIGSTIDKPSASVFMKVCFDKFERLIQDDNLPSRSKFMYKDLIDLRSNRWVPRRKEEKAKTIAEIREDVEAEERRQAQLSAQLNSRGGKGGSSDTRNSLRGDKDFYQRQSSLTAAASRPRPVKPVNRADDDGFITVGGPGRNPLPGPAIISPIKAKEPVAILKQSAASTSVAPLSVEQLERKIKNMRNDYIASGESITELLSSWTEMSGNAEAGQEIVRQNVDRMMECKDEERFAIYKIIRVLCEQGKLTKSDVQKGLMDPIEFIESTVCDCPRAIEYLGILLGDMLRIKMFDINWLCDQCKKIESPETLIQVSFTAWSKESNPDQVKAQMKAHETTLKTILSAEAFTKLVETL